MQKVKKNEEKNQYLSFVYLINKTAKKKYIQS